VAEAAAGGTAHDLNIISGATVTIMVIDDSIVRSGIRVARALGLGGLVPAAAPTGPRFAIDPDASAAGLVHAGRRRHRAALSLDVGQVNAAFEQMDDPRAAPADDGVPGRHLHRPLRRPGQRSRRSATRCWAGRYANLRALAGPRASTPSWSPRAALFLQGLGLCARRLFDRIS
jgi:hypothetical protein